MWNTRYTTSEVRIIFAINETHVDKIQVHFSIIVFWFYVMLIYR
jgi:hypothetical protein